MQEVQFYERAQAQTHSMIRNLPEETVWTVATFLTNQRVIEVKQTSCERADKRRFWTHTGHWQSILASM